MATYQVRIDADGEKILSEPLSGLEGSLATEEVPGVVQPDGKTVRVDNTGVLSAIGGNLLLNSEEWITESGTFIAPVTGWYDALLIGGGNGAVVSKTLGFLSSGSSGSILSSLVFLHAGDNISVVIGAGGIGRVSESGADTSYIGGATTFGDLSTAGTLDTKFIGVTMYPNHRVSEGTWSMLSFGAGIGGGVDTVSPLTGNVLDGGFYGAGAAAALSSISNESTYPTGAGNGGQGAIRLRFYDPAKAAGPIE